MIERHDNHSEQHELRKLLTAAVLEAATADEWDRLNEWLLADANARQFASRFLEEESTLRRQFEMFGRVAAFHTPGDNGYCSLGGVDQIDGELDAEVNSVNQLNADGTADEKHPLIEPARLTNPVRRALAIALSLAACLLLAFGAFELLRHGQQLLQLAERHDGQPSAVQVGLMYQDQFSDPDTGLADDLSLSTPIRVGDVITTDRGLAKLRFTCGVEVLLKGPAELEVLSAMRASLRRGTLTARVEESAHGFRIDTPNSKIIDLGTEFGLSVDENGATDMVVFSGKVAFEYSDTQPDDSLAPAPSIPPSNLKMLGGGRLLTDGQAMRITESGEVKRLMTVRNSDYPLPSDRHRQPADWTPIIGSVSDNLREGDTTMCYRIVHHGFDEDARAFVDRPYEWNGLNSEFGLPNFLRGADYVMPFCDDKLSSTLEVRIAITRPARLFVLIDDRVELPQWLTERFRDSGYDIGIDESATAASWLSLGRGAGVSIDKCFSVWYLDVELPSNVLLGSMKSPTNISLMYCVAAIPLERATTLAAEPIRNHRARLGQGFTTPDLLPEPTATIRAERVEEFSQLTLAKPSTSDAAAGSQNIKFRIESCGGRYLPHRRVVLDRGTLPLLNNGQVAQNNDDLDQNVWYDGQGRFSVDMLRPVDVAEINTFSWHWLERAPQFFTVWGSSAEQMPDASFVEAEQADGWELIGYVNTLPLGHGGVHASSLRGRDGNIGRYRHLLWITEDTVRGTFFTEIDVHTANE